MLKKASDDFETLKQMKIEIENGTADVEKIAENPAVNQEILELLLKEYPDDIDKIIAGVCNNSILLLQYPEIILYIVGMIHKKGNTGIFYNKKLDTFPYHHFDSFRPYIKDQGAGPWITTLISLCKQHNAPLPFEPVDFELMAMFDKYEGNKTDVTEVLFLSDANYLENNQDIIGDAIANIQKIGYSLNEREMYSDDFLSLIYKYPAIFEKSLKYPRAVSWAREFFEYCVRNELRPPTLRFGKAFRWLAKRDEDGISYESYFRKHSLRDY